jgi:hypothetical protein
LTLYVDELASYHQIGIECSFRLFVDSTSAITNVNTLRDLIPKRRFPNHADVLSTISSAHYVIARFLLTHVHSHQDDDIAFDELPFPVQLNVLCDRMATAHLDLQLASPAERTLPSPLLPRTLNVEVLYGAQVISAHYVSRLRECIALDRHRLFLQTKYKWTDHIWETIAWDALKATARKPTLAHQVSRSKVVHNWLNLGSQRFKFGGGGTELEIARCCPYCRQEEDFTHLLSCPAPRALKFRYDAMIPLNKTLNAAWEAGHALRQAVQAWTLQPSTSIVIEDDPADEYLEIQPAIDLAVSSQAAIGWTNLFRGFVSLEWGNIHWSTATPLTAEEQRTRSEKALLPLIGAIQDYTIAIWRSRNSVLHEAGSDSRDIVHAAVNQSITQLYNLQSTYSNILRSYFTMPLEELLRRSPRQRKRWLQLARLATSHSSLKGSRQQLISTYFPYAPTVREESFVVDSTDEVTTQPASPQEPLSIPTTITANVG